MVTMIPANKAPWACDRSNSNINDHRPPNREA